MKNSFTFLLVIFILISGCEVKITEDLTGTYELNKSDNVGGFYMERYARMEIWKDNNGNYQYSYLNKIYDAMYGSTNSESSWGYLKVIEKVDNYWYKLEITKSSDDLKDKIYPITVKKNSLSFSWIGGKENNFTKIPPIESENNNSGTENDRESSVSINAKIITNADKNIESNPSELKTKDRIKYKLANTTFTLEFISEVEGKIYYDNGIGFTIIKYSDKLPNGNLVWEETDGQTKTGVYTFKDSNLESGVFSRYKDNKKFDFTRIKE